jgi:uncharacterized protein YndB with AHSA1/START domain
VKRFEARTTIQAPPEQVFDYVSDFTRHGEWAGHGLQATKQGDGPVGVGTTYATTASQFGTQREHSTITEFDRPSTFGWDSTGTLGTLHHRFDVTADGDSTALTKVAELTHPSFLAKVMGWKIGKGIPQGLASDVTNIKANIERAPTVPPPG